jgi:hypothetical protein
MGTKREAPEGACFTGCRLPLQQQPSGAGGVGVPGFAQFLRSPAVSLICSEFASASGARFLFGWVAVLAKPAPHPRLFPLQDTPVRVSVQRITQLTGSVKRPKVCSKKDGQVVLFCATCAATYEEAGSATKNPAHRERKITSWKLAGN